jgi:predicted Zn-dependent protease
MILCAPTRNPTTGWRNDMQGERPLRNLPIRLIAGLATLTAVLLPAVASSAGLIRDAEIERTLGSMTAPIFAAAGYPSDAIHVYILNDRRINAFVANGNNMFLNTGLLEALETPEELQGVIAHETGHLAGGHQTRRRINLRNARGPALLGLLAGIAAGIAGGGEAGLAVAAGSQSLVQRRLLRYTRGEEAAADQAALTYLARADINPVGMQKVLSRLRSQEVFNIGHVDPFILNHPLSAERMQLIEHAVAETAGHHYPAHPQLDYWYGRMRAKLKGFLDNPESVLNQLEGKSETEEVLYEKAVALYRLPAMQEAIAAVDRLIAMKPNDPFYNELKGQILFETGHADKAVPLYRKAVALAPHEPLLEAGLGRALLALDDSKADAEALKVLQDARRRDPGDAWALRALATAYSRAGNQGMARLATAERYALTGRLKDAKLHARRAVAVMPEGSPGWLRAQDILSLKDD